MKTLILSLARFGDILTTLPTLKAYKRENPDHELVLMVRKRFSEVTKAFSFVDQIIEFDTQFILSPSLFSNDGYRDSIVRLAKFISEVKAQGFTKIINFSYSPFSSFLTNALANENTRIVGYKRYRDGHLELPDEWTAYFYAQVGVARSNRIHLFELFANTLGVSLSEEDWNLTPVQNSISNLKRRYIVIHLGASEKGKTYPITQWQEVINSISAAWNGDIVLIGSSNESELGDRLQNNEAVINLIGKTQFSDLISIVSKSELLLGADSAPIHIASLTNIPTLNLSCEYVNLFETGPRSPGSRILYKNKIEDISSDHVSAEALRMLSGGLPTYATFYINSQRDILDLKNHQEPLAWQLIKYLYFGQHAPQSRDIEYASGLINLYDVNQLVIEQLYILQRSPKDTIALSLLKRSDEIMRAIERSSEELGVIVRWFEAEKIKIAPGGIKSVLEKTFICHKELDEKLLELQKNVTLTNAREVEHGA